MEKCLLCQRKEETVVTGALSSKGNVTAHQNCLLYASGIFCQESPELDDLFGFSVEDVLKEHKRGSKLECKKCLKRGATVGCEIGRCKKSFHYPCAVEAGSAMIEDENKGKYGIYCINHTPQKGDSTANTESPAVSSAQNSKDRSKTKIPKILVISIDKQDDSPSKKKRRWSRIKSNESGSSEETDPDMALFAPIESDLEEIVTSSAGLGKNGVTTESPAQPPSVNHSADKREEDITVIHSDDESESLLLPVHICIESEPYSETGFQKATQTSCSFIKSEAMPLENGHNGIQPVDTPSEPPTEQAFAEPGTSPSQSNTGGQRSSSPSISLAISSSQSETSQPAASSTPPPASVVDNTPHIDSLSFWKSCNTAGCTQAIFTDFLGAINEVAERIQGDQASQEDCDLALSVMAASGKLLEFVAKQQKELQRKLEDLQGATSAMNDVITVLQGHETDGT